MIRFATAVAGCLLLAGQAAAQTAPAPVSAPELKDLRAKVSYLIGRNIGQSLKQDQMDVDVELMLRALREATSGVESVLSETETQEAFRAFRKQQEAKQAEAMLSQNADLKAAAEKNTKEAAAFLAENGKKEGVVTLPSGVQYKVLKSGTGATPKASDSVSAHYAGRLIDGTKFDSSYDRGQPLVIPVQGVIPGWTEVLQKMKVGDKWEVYIPGDSAYGLNGSPPTIGPNALLIFEMELIAVEGAELPKP